MVCAYSSRTASSLRIHGVVLLGLSFLDLRLLGVCNCFFRLLQLPSTSHYISERARSNTNGVRMPPQLETIGDAYLAATNLTTNQVRVRLAVGMSPDPWRRD